MYMVITVGISILISARMFVDRVWAYLLGLWQNLHGMNGSEHFHTFRV